MLKRKFENLSEIVVERRLRPFFRKIIGWDKQQEEIDTLHFILNNCVDITAAKKASGLLRQVQLVDAEMLRIFHEVCTEHSLKYWLDWGTLLGAVRHKGFIPWDDDLDVTMPREDYNRAREILPKELEKFGFEVTVKGGKRISVTLWKAGAIMDIFPMDNISAHSFSDEKDFADKLYRYRCFYVKKEKSLTEQQLSQEKENMIGGYVTENPIWYHNPEFMNFPKVHSDSSIFPLKLIRFEDYEFYAPNDCDGYLTDIYGDYMSFPKSGALHHKGNGNGIHNNSEKYDVDIDSLLEELKGKFVNLKTYE